LDRLNDLSRFILEGLYPAPPLPPQPLPQPQPLSQPPQPGSKIHNDIPWYKRFMSN
jgi:hypothetical protein